MSEEKFNPYAANTIANFCFEEGYVHAENIFSQQLDALRQELEKAKATITELKYLDDEGTEEARIIGDDNKRLIKELADERAGRPLFAKATDRVAELENRIAELEQAQRPMPKMETVKDFADHNGFLEVWMSWRDTMLSQGRDVPSKRMHFETLPQDDIDLDRKISFDVLLDFVAWYWTHPHPLPLSPAPAAPSTEAGK